MDRIKHKAKVNKWPSILEHELQKEVMIAKRELKACIARDSDQILIEIPYQVESKFMSKELLLTFNRRFTFKGKEAKCFAW